MKWIRPWYWTLTMQIVWGWACTKSQTEMKVPTELTAVDESNGGETGADGQDVSATTEKQYEKSSIIEPAQTAAEAAPGAQMGQEETPVADDISAVPRLLVPLYRYPLTAFEQLDPWWDEIVSSEHSVGLTVIVTPANGPNAPPLDVQNYLFAMEKLKDHGVSILGYVTTSYASRSYEDVKSDIDAYLSIYRHRQSDQVMIDGIFFDESYYVHGTSLQGSLADSLGYFRSLHEYVKTHSAIGGDKLTVMNPGTSVTEDYFSQEVVDLIITFENNIGEWQGFSTPTFHRDYDRNRFGSIIYLTAANLHLQSALRNLHDLNYGWIYLTHADLPNPYSERPEYFSDLLEFTFRP